MEKNQLEMKHIVINIQKNILKKIHQYALNNIETVEQKIGVIWN